MFFEEGLSNNSQNNLGDNELNRKPFTSAPKMAKPEDFGLTEISLDSKTVNDNKNMFPTDNYDRNEIDLFSPDKQQVVMPYVEDGLSSGSELSCASITSDENKASNYNNDDIVLNSKVLNDITRDIQELRMTINNTKTKLCEQNVPLPNLTSELEFKTTVPSNRPLKSEASKKEYESDEDTDKLLTKPYEHPNHRIDIPELKNSNQLECEKRRKGKEGYKIAVRHPDYPSVLIEGLIFRANYLGSTQLLTDTKLSRDSRMLQAQEAVGRVKAPDTESQPSVAVELFISTEKILVLNTSLSDIMMDHSLKTISYIADIGNILVLMARRITEVDTHNTATMVNSEPTNSAASSSSSCTHSTELPHNPPPLKTTSSTIQQHQNKIICHVFESEEAQLIAQTIGNAFQVAYIEFLKANGIDDPKLFKEVDYQDVLNDQQIIGDELKLFASSDQQKEIIIPKQKGETMGVVIVESGWGSMIPTVVLANMNPTGPAARCGLLNIGNQIISVNGTSLVGLPLSTCQQIIKKTKSLTAVKLVIISCPPVVEVNIRRPDPKYQLGFSVQNGVICSLLRGGIAERGGVRVGHHIIEINGISVVAMTHEKIVNILATSFGEIHIRTMPSSIFRLLTGQETPCYI